MICCVCRSCVLRFGWVLNATWKKYDGSVAFIYLTTAATVFVGWRRGARRSFASCSSFRGLFTYGRAMRSGSRLAGSGQQIGAILTQIQRVAQGLEQKQNKHNDCVVLSVVRRQKAPVPIVSGGNLAGLDNTVRRAHVTAGGMPLAISGCGVNDCGVRCFAVTRTLLKPPACNELCFTCYRIPG
ncbi:hypothetical protein CPB83DRAFT_238211 [Crepidotus variabilis]|uniref:Uncharacterized protein n=1 Tax=Crepidotus variabilis TaxID=179855 RepID=A0A9P6EHP5_9AGAR|nr:hypothetical protein CPB83DRAFT_238211 [Crepidotus variabilis]